MQILLKISVSNVGKALECSIFDIISFEVVSRLTQISDTSSDCEIFEYLGSDAGGHQRHFFPDDFQVSCAIG